MHSQFSPSQALDYLRLVQQIRLWSKGEAFQFPDSVQIRKVLYLRGQVFGVGIHSASEFILVFRGSETWYEWMKDFHIRQVVFPMIKNGGKVHRGFYEFYLTIREQVKSSLFDTPLTKPLTVVGYSLGGAIATMLSIEFASHQPSTLIRHLTFGTPKVGNGMFVDQFQRKVPNSVGIINPGDPIPHQPVIADYQAIPNAWVLPKTNLSLFWPHSVDAYFFALAKLTPDHATQTAPHILSQRGYNYYTRQSARQSNV